MKEKKMGELQERDGKLDTKSMLEENFFQQFKGSPTQAPQSQAKQPLQASRASSEPTTPNVNTEQVLMDAYEARDNLIASFSSVKLGSTVADTMKDAINKIGNIIVNMGGEAETFDPLAHISGLEAPSIRRYAGRVIENTIESYKLGKISGARVDEESNGKSIIVTFEGQSDEVPYKAIGTITTPGTWLGTEAIDYVYTPGEGKMSVKVANQSGHWEDASDNYAISWELFEGKPEENLEKKASQKEDEQGLLENKEKDNIDMGFPIEEK